MYPVHRMRVYNTGDAPIPGHDKRYEGLWEVIVKNRLEGRALEKILHTRFEHLRKKRANGNNTEWFCVSFDEVQKFLNSKNFVVRQLSIEEVEDIHAKAEHSTSVGEANEYAEEKALIVEEEAEIAKPPETFKEIFFRIFLHGRIPRRIQDELWNLMVLICANDKRLETLYSGIVQWPTGTGKTIAMLMIFVLVKERSVRLGQIYRGLLVTRRNDIFNTISSEFHKLSEFGITLYDGSNGKLSKLTIPSNKHVVVMACPDSLRIEETGMRSLPDMTHVHYDEVHRITAKLFFGLLKEMLVKWKTQLLTGTSATPKTSDSEQHRKLAELFGDPYTTIHKCDVDEAVREGWIATPRFIVNITPKLEKGKEAAYDKALAISVESTIRMKKAKGFWKGGKCIAYTRSISSAKSASEEFRKIMPDAKVYLAIDGERTDKEFVDSPADGSVQVLFACDRYKEGSDIKGLEMTCVLIGSAISAYILIQIQGRSLRIDYEGKEGWCLIVCPCEGDETEQEVLDRIALDILIFIGDSRPLGKKDITRYVNMYFGEVIVNGIVCSREETIERIQATYIRREYAKRTPKEKYETIRTLNKEMGLSSKLEYSERASEHPKFIEKPQEYFKDFWDSWYHFLGVDTTAFPQTKPEWIRVCKDMGFWKKSWSDALYVEKRGVNMPEFPEQMYEGYDNWDKEMEVEEEEHIY